MKKVFLMISLAFAFSQTSTAQLDFGVKAGLNYNSESIQSVSEDVFTGAEAKLVTTQVFGCVLNCQ